VACYLRKHSPNYLGYRRTPVLSVAVPKEFAQEVRAIKIIGRGRSVE
jgi:hypothetical protein